MSVLFDAADKHANKRKNKLLDSDPSSRALFASHAKAPLIPTAHFPHSDASHAPTLTETYAHLDLSARHVDAAWALSACALLFPVAADVFSPTFLARPAHVLDLPYRCDFLYVSLFLSLPGISVHLFCLFLLLSNRCRLGFACYTAGVALFVVAVELHCFYAEQGWCAVLFFAGIVVGVAGQAWLVRAIRGPGGAAPVAHVAAVVLACAGFVGQVWPGAGDGEKGGSSVTTTGMVGLGCVVWAGATWLTLLPVRVAYVQLYKS